MRTLITGVLIATLAGAAGAEADLERLVTRAGDAATENERLEAIRALAESSASSQRLREDALQLEAEIRRWSEEPRLDYFGGQVRKHNDYEMGIGKDSALYPLTLLYRGRMLTWALLEYGGYANRELYDAARTFFEDYHERFPENPVARMYLGEPMLPVRVFDVPDGAPRWAAAQREAIERLADIIEWWIGNRMREDGQFGGGWGDDCEMWRWWTPVLLGFDNPEINEAQQRFSTAIMNQPHMSRGYTSHVYDVEHTAEDSADAIAPMMHLAPGEPEWTQRAMHIVDLAESLWTGVNNRGQLQFRSTYFSSERVDEASQRACDTVYHPRVLQPALLYWQRTGDARMAQLTTRWMDTWVDATARAERGKPAGIVPSAIHWPDGTVGGLGSDWWDPQNHNEAGLYRWPSAMESMLTTLLLTWGQTKDERYLAPLRSMAQARLRHVDEVQEDEPGPGSEAWCAQRLGGRILSGVLGKYRLLTGDTAFDALLERDATPYQRFILFGGREALEQALEDTAGALRVNFAGYTSEVRYTDRVLRFPTLFQEGRLFLEGKPDILIPDTQLLYSSITGDPGDAGYFPLNAVRWITPPRGLAALVTHSANLLFAAELYHFGDDGRRMAVLPLLLERGTYTVRLRTHDGGLLLDEQAEVDWKTPISFTLPPRLICILTFDRAAITTVP